MEILDNKHLMFIEPKVKRTELAINDKLSDLAAYLQKNMKSNNDFTNQIRKASSFRGR